jgi:hypothetical protein
MQKASGNVIFVYWMAEERSHRWREEEFMNWPY